MRVLIVSVPGSGHFNPLLTVARELIHRGHEVRWYTGAYYQNAIETLGAKFEPMRKAYDFGGMNKDEAFPHLVGLTRFSIQAALVSPSTRMSAASWTSKCCHSY